MICWLTSKVSFKIKFDCLSFVYSKWNFLNDFLMIFCLDLMTFWKWLWFNRKLFKICWPICMWYNLIKPTKHFSIEWAFLIFTYRTDFHSNRHSSGDSFSIFMTSTVYCSSYDLNLTLQFRKLHGFAYFSISLFIFMIFCCLHLNGQLKNKFYAKHLNWCQNASLTSFQVEHTDCQFVLYFFFSLHFVVLIEYIVTPAQNVFNWIQLISSLYHIQKKKKMKNYDRCYLLIFMIIFGLTIKTLNNKPIMKYERKCVQNLWSFILCINRFRVRVLKKSVTWYCLYVYNV